MLVKRRYTILVVLYIFECSWNALKWATQYIFIYEEYKYKQIADIHKLL